MNAEALSGLYAWATPENGLAVAHGALAKTFHYCPVLTNSW